MKISDRVVRYLTEARVMEEIKSNSRKYRSFKSGLNDHLYFVGKNGAVRAGNTVSDSVSITDSLHARMKAWEKDLS